MQAMMLARKGVSEETLLGDPDQPVSMIASGPPGMCFSASTPRAQLLGLGGEHERSAELAQRFCDNAGQALRSLDNQFVISFFDREDWHRIGYLARKHPAPLNILHMMSDGHVEDFFGSWCGEDDDPAAFNPDNDWRILFDVP